MQHIKVTFRVAGIAEAEMLIAALSAAGYEGFEETETELFAYIGAGQFNGGELREIARGYNVIYTLETLAEQNWNAVWESNFEPVIVKDFCTIKAHFHHIITNTPYQITITPKMSFGTGHHATTQQMIMLMKEMAFLKKTVLDFGTGTGVLAILAEMLGASNILAIDNDEWSVENAKENVECNGCTRITVRQGSLESVSLQDRYDVILANINRNILLQYMSGLYNLLVDGGELLISGLLPEDRGAMLASAGKEGFIFKQGTEQNNWIALRFTK